MAGISMDGQATTAEVYRRYDDGYIARRMTRQDAEHVITWYSDLVGGLMSRQDLLTCLEVFPATHGFYAGEVQGQMVASCVRLPWAPAVFYGSLYYVHKEHRGKGYGTRLRDEVARDYVGSATLCIDAMPGKVTDNNIAKFGYRRGATTATRWKGVAATHAHQCQGVRIEKIEDVALQKVLEYDDRHFITPANNIRHEFLKRWVRNPGCACVVAVDAEGHVSGYGCRRPCERPSAHVVGPVYADTVQIARVLLGALFNDINGHIVIVPTLDINSDAVGLMEELGFEREITTQRMYIGDNLDNLELSTNYAITSLAVCGF